MSNMTNKQCPGSGQQGIPGVGTTAIYPHCPICGREFSAQGRKAQARLGNPWQAVPKHFASAA